MTVSTIFPSSTLALDGFVWEQLDDLMQPAVVPTVVEPAETVLPQLLAHGLVQVALPVDRLYLIQPIDEVVGQVEGEHLQQVQQIDAGLAEFRLERESIQQNLHYIVHRVPLESNGFVL